MYANVVRRVPVRYGWVELIKNGIGYYKIVLVFLFTFFLCVAIPGGRHAYDFHLHPEPKEPHVTITASGFLSIYPEFLDDGTIRITSNSSDPIDLIVEASDGRDLFTCNGLMPGESFSFNSEGVGQITASAS